MSTEGIGNLTGAGSVPQTKQTPAAERTEGASGFDKVLDQPPAGDSASQTVKPGEVGGVGEAVPPLDASLINKIPQREALLQQADLRIGELRGLDESLRAKEATSSEGHRLLQEVIDSSDRMSEIQNLLQKTQLSPQQLLGLQAEMHKLTHQIELMTKLVEGATSSVKSALNQQV